jgi:hypothetical protein
MFIEGGGTEMIERHDLCRYSVALLAIALLSGGCEHVLGQSPRTGEQGASETSTDDAPPRFLAKIVRQTHGTRVAIVWGEPQDGLAVGVGAVSTSLKSPRWPIIDAYLENRGNVQLYWIIRARNKFILELDDQFYAESDFGGPSSRMEPGKQYGPISVGTRWFRKIPRLEPISVHDERAPRPVLTEGPHTLRFYYKLDRTIPVNARTMKPNTQLIPSAKVEFTVSLSPYPTDEAVATFTRELRGADRDVRREAALAAGYLRLPGCSHALVGVLRDSDAAIRRYALESLAKIKDPATIKPVRESLSDGDYEVRLAAASCLVELGEPLDVGWVEPIIKSKKSVFQNAIWLVRRHGGDQAASALIRCLDMDDPSVGSYYNYTLVWQIADCGGPRLKYNHNFDGKGTAEQVEENRKILAQLQEWLQEHSAKP